MDIIDILNAKEKERVDIVSKQVEEGCSACSQWDEYYGCSKCQHVMEL